MMTSCAPPPQHHTRNHMVNTANGQDDKWTCSPVEHSCLAPWAFSAAAEIQTLTQFARMVAQDLGLDDDMGLDAPPPAAASEVAAPMGRRAAMMLSSAQQAWPHACLALIRLLCLLALVRNGSLAEFPKLRSLFFLCVRSQATRTTLARTEPLPPPGRSIE